jgi:hypothetical protein
MLNIQSSDQNIYYTYNLLGRYTKVPIINYQHVVGIEQLIIAQAWRFSVVTMVENRFGRGKTNLQMPSID